MKVLIVSYAYAPDLSPRAFRWATIAERWADAGYEIDVVCGPDANKPIKSNLNGVNVYRLGSRLVARVRQRLYSQADGLPTANLGPRTGRQSNLRTVLVGVLRWLWRLVYWPDLAGPWFFVARRRIRALARGVNYDAIITVSPLFTSHLIGLSCRQKFSGSIWLADYGDPFSYSEGGHSVNNRLLFGVLNRWVENRILQHADVVSFTTDETRDLYARLFPATRARVVVVPPLIPDVSQVSGDKTGASEDSARTDKIVLTYTGRFYPGVREPGPLLEFIDSFLDAEARYRDRIEIRIVGPLERVEASFRAPRRWPGVVKLLGRVPPERARMEIQAADGLINLGNTTSYQLPSKVVEYVSSGKPILNICTSTSDSAARFFDGYPLVCNIVTGASSNSEAIELLRNFLDEMVGRRVDAKVVEKLVAPYTSESVTAQYSDLIATDWKVRQ